MGRLFLLACGVLAPLVYLLGVLSAARACPAYRHRSRFISELGTGPSPKALHFNAGLGMAGAMLVAFAGGVALSLDGGGLAHAIPLGLALFGASTVLMAFFPCDPGCPRLPVSRMGMAHGLLGLLGSCALIVTIVLFGVIYWPLGPAIALYSLLTGLLAAVLLATLIAFEMPSRQGLVQRLYVGVTFGWVSALSVSFLLQGVGKA